jgi:hypothetical protein
MIKSMVSFAGTINAEFPPSVRSAECWACVSFGQGRIQYPVPHPRGAYLDAEVPKGVAANFAIHTPAMLAALHEW